MLREIVTYAGNVMYSELADYFYVWLRQALKDEYPNFSALAPDDSREAVSNPGRGRDSTFYTTVLTNVFAEVKRKLKPAGRLAFTFHHASEDAWNYLERALIDAGYVVEYWWPIFAEMESSVPLQGKENNGHLDIVFVCAKRGEISAPSEQDSLPDMKRKLAARVKLVAADHRALVAASRIQDSTWREHVLNE